MSVQSGQGWASGFSNGSVGQPQPATQQEAQTIRVPWQVAQTATSSPALSLGEDDVG